MWTRLDWSHLSDLDRDHPTPNPIVPSHGNIHVELFSFVNNGARLGAYYCCNGLTSKDDSSDSVCPVKHIEQHRCVLYVSLWVGPVPQPGLLNHYDLYGRKFAIIENNGFTWLAQKKISLFLINFARFATVSIQDCLEDAASRVLEHVRRIY